MADIKDVWLKNMKFEAAGVSKQESANFIIENNPKFDGLLNPGFYGADIFVTEGKNSSTGTVSFGTAVLLQNPDTWGRQDKSKRRWAITAAHTVMTTGREGNPKKVSTLRLRKPILPWKGFPKDTEKYKAGPDATNHLYDSIVVPRKHIFPHPKFNGNWNCGYDVALIAIPEMAPSENAIKVPFVGYEFDNFPDSICVNGFPALNLNQKQRHTHIPYFSIRNRDDNDDEWEVSIIRPQKKINTGARMVRYPVATKPGISGGAVVAEGNVIGIHNAKRNATNGWGTVFTEELKSWIKDIYSNKWDTSLGKYVSPNAHHEHAIKLQELQKEMEKKNAAQMKVLMAKQERLERELANISSGGAVGKKNNNTGTGYQIPNQSGGIFSNNKKQTGSPFGNFSSGNSIGSSIFGNNNRGSSLFGNNNKSGGDGGLFGSNGGGIFAKNNNRNSSGGLFGNKSQNSSGKLFGNNDSSNNNNSGGLFGNNNNKSDRHMQGNQESGITQGERVTNQRYVIDKDIPRRECTTPSKPTPKPKPRIEHMTQSKPSPKSKPNPQSAKEGNVPISANTGAKRGRTDPPVPSNSHPPKRTRRENTGRSKPCDAELLKPGTVVVLTGLTSPKAQELNGKTATIDRFDDLSSRWIVNLDGKKVTIRQENIKRKDRTRIANDRPDHQSSKKILLTVRRTFQTRGSPSETLKMGWKLNVVKEEIMNGKHFVLVNHEQLKRNQWLDISDFACLDGVENLQESKSDHTFTRRSQQIPTEPRRDRHASMPDLFTVLFPHEAEFRRNLGTERNLEAQRRIQAQRRREVQRRREAEFFSLIYGGLPPPRRSFFRF